MCLCAADMGERDLESRLIGVVEKPRESIRRLQLAFMLAELEREAVFCAASLPQLLPCSCIVHTLPCLCIERLPVPPWYQPLGQPRAAVELASCEGG